jgi:zinc and cadmium transporter
MIGTFILIILSTLLVSAIALLGIVTVLFRVKVEKFTDFLVALSIGALIGGAFLHLIAEAAEEKAMEEVFIFVIVGFIFFFFIEKLFHWRHCHDSKCKIHSFAYMSLLGDSIHNFIDGIIIAGSFIASFELGIASVIAIVIHEIPQEIGDFGVLVHGGMRKKQALFFNFLTALAAVLGGIAGFFVITYFEVSLSFLLAFAAGGFIYIAASDLIPELRKEQKLARSLLHFAIIIIGIIIMYFLKILG